MCRRGRARGRRRRWRGGYRRRLSPAGLAGTNGTGRSVGFVRVGPSRKAGHDVEFSKKLRNHLVGVFFTGEGVHLRDDPDEGCLDALNGLRRKVLALLLKTTLVLDELFAIKLGHCRGG